MSPMMYSSSRANRHQPYPWTGAPNQVSGSSSHAAAPPATAYTQTSATHAGYPTDGSYPSVHGPSFQNSGNHMLHPFYDPHRDQFNATLESAFPHLRTPQIGSTASVTGGSTYQGYAPGNLGTNFPHSSYSELANYAGNYNAAGSTSGAAQAAAPSGGYATLSSTHHDPSSDRRESVAEPSAKGQKRKSRKDATDATAVWQGEPLGDKSDEERARKKKKAIQQREYRGKDRGAMQKLEDALPDEYKVYESRRNRKTVTRSVECIGDLVKENKMLKMNLTDIRAALQQALQDYNGAVEGRDAMARELEILRRRESMMLMSMSELQNRVNFLESGM